MARDAEVQLVSQLWHDTVLCSVTWRKTSAEKPSSNIKNKLPAGPAAAHSCLRQKAAGTSPVAAYLACMPSLQKPRLLLPPPLKEESACMGFSGHQDHHPCSKCYFLRSSQHIPQANTVIHSGSPVFPSLCLVPLECPFLLLLTQLRWI